MRPTADILDHDDLTSWIRAAAEEWVQSHPWFSRRLLAQRMGIQSGIFNNVIQGVRKMPVEYLDALAKVFELDEGERAVLKAMSDLDRARNEEQRDKARSALEGHRQLLRARRLGPNHARFVTHWYTVAIHELMQIPGFVADPHWIADRLVPSITPTQAAEALQTLQSLAQAASSANGVLTTGHRPAHTIAPDWHTQMISLALSATDLPRDQRHFESYTSAVPRAAIPKLREQIQAFLREAIATCSLQGEPPETVVQLSVQLFPLMADDPAPAGRPQGNDPD